MSRPSIGITSGEIIDRDHPHAAVVYGQTKMYTASITAAGGTPYILDISESDAVIEDYLNKMDGFVLAGGNDVNPASYGQEPTYDVKELSDKRDEFELKLVEKALERRIPMLLICRGMQLMNVHRGGTLIQNLPTDEINHLESTDLKDIEHLAHGITIDEYSILAEILGTRVVEVNSHHHQAIDKLGNGVVATARASDGIIEAMEMPGYPVLGVQWHPESLLNVEPRMLRLFQWLVDPALGKQPKLTAVPDKLVA